IVDERGWKQKFSVSYALNVRSYVPVGSRHENRVFSFAEIPWMEVTVHDSTFQHREVQPPQFRIEQTTITLGPSVDQLPAETLSHDYSDTWGAKEIHPDHLTYACVPKTVTTEKSIVGKLQVSPLPSVTIEGGAKWANSDEPHILATAIDFERSSISISPLGGVKWKYIILQDPSSFRHRVRLGCHRGEISMSKNFPSSIEARISTIFQV